MDELSVAVFEALWLSLSKLNACSPGDDAIQLSSSMRGIEPEELLLLLSRDVDVMVLTDVVCDTE
jgi:hypothetical protein